MTADGFYAVIEAIWPTYELEDLDQVVIQGYPLTIEKTEADKSKDLKEGIRLKALQIKYIRKCATIRKGHPAPPHNRRLQKKFKPPPRPVTIVKERTRDQIIQVPVVQQVIQKAPAVDTDLLVRKMTAAFGGVMDQKLKEQEDSLRAEFQALKDSKPTAPPDLESLKDSIQGMLNNVVVQSSTPQVQETSEVQDTPLFIPSKILSGKTTDTIQVQQSTSKATGVDDAAAKLKALRKQRKKHGME